jgi:ribonuclease J
VISRGFVDPQSANGLVDGSIEVVAKTLKRTASRNITDWGELKNAVRRDLSAFLSDKTRKRPIILPLIVEV